ncbi:hypothetical protein J6590_009140 [Homalodisca vitripennis]|nr:hypothetical protein J6590_009140 [Homalodisca vitripennis]
MASGTVRTPSIDWLITIADIPGFLTGRFFVLHPKLEMCFDGMTKTITPHGPNMVRHRQRTPTESSCLVKSRRINSHVELCTSYWTNLEVELRKNCRVCGDHVVSDHALAFAGDSQGNSVDETCKYKL